MLGERKKKSTRGFAGMAPEKQREIARKGGRTAHERGLAHQWTSEEARHWGRVGGLRSKRRPIPPAADLTESTDPTDRPTLS